MTIGQRWRELVSHATKGPWTDECSVAISKSRRITTRHVLAVPVADVVHGIENARLIVAQRHVAEAMAEWIAADEWLSNRFSTPEEYDDARQRYADACDNLRAACVEAVSSPNSHQD